MELVEDGGKALITAPVMGEMKYCVDEEAVAEKSSEILSTCTGSVGHCNRADVSEMLQICRRKGWGRAIPRRISARSKKGREVNEICKGLRS